MSALLNTASQYKLNANMLQAKRQMEKESSQVFVVCFLSILKLCKSPPNIISLNPSPDTKKNIHIDF